MTVHELMALLATMPQDATVVVGHGEDGGLYSLRPINVSVVQLGGEDRKGSWLLEIWPGKRPGLEGPFFGVHIG